MVLAPHTQAFVSPNDTVAMVRPGSPASSSAATIDSPLVGLDYILENPDYVEKLALALESEDVAVKKQVFELLSALCVYNTEGYTRTFECLDFYKTKAGERYRYKFIVRELENAEHGSEYQIALLAFINCLILSTQDTRERIRIRSEFIALRLLHVLHDLRSKEDADVAVQLDVFFEQKESDESQIDSDSNGIDLSSPLEVFDAILRQIADTPQEAPFVCILQHLLRIESKEAISDIIWDTAERLVHRATLIETADEAQNLCKTQIHTKSLMKLKGLSIRDNSCSCQCHQRCDNMESTNSTTHTSPEHNEKNENSALNDSLSQPQLVSTTISTPLPPPLPQHLKYPPPPPPLSNLSNPYSGCENVPSLNLPKLPQQAIPTPSTKMRTVNWSKIPSSQVLHGSQNNLWAKFAKTHSNSDTPINLDWNTLEALFCLPVDKASSTTPTKSKPVTTQQNDMKLTKRESNEIILLDSKRSLNINIFLKQFRRSNDDMIKLIENGCSEDFGSEKLRGLLKIFPSKDEIEMLKSVSDQDKLRLACAEKFLLQLIQVSNCELRIQAMLLKEELAPCVNHVETSIHAILQAAKDVKQSAELQEVIFMIIVAGNFLNAGGYAGDAAGLKLSSLQKIADIRGNKPGVSLLHFIAMQAESKSTRLITFVDELTTLEEASKISTEQLKNDIRTLKSKVTAINQQLQQPKIAPEILPQFNNFVENAMKQVEELETSFNDIEHVRIDMAHFFCEEVTNFKLEDCFKVLATFANTWKSAASENNRRKVLEKEGEARRLSREAQMKKRQLALHQGEHAFKRKNIPSGSNDILDEIISLSPRITKRRIDVNGNTNNVVGSVDAAGTPSPDVTPNGSLSRRRNRQNFNDDEGELMDFLRTGGEFARERGGSADTSGYQDRPWYKSSRRRLNLPEINNDRERPTSPSPVIDSDSSSRHHSQSNTGAENPTPNGSLETPSWFVDLDRAEDGGDAKEKTRARRLPGKLIHDFGPSGLSTLRESETSEEETLISRPTYSGRRSSLKLNADVIGAMGAIEECQGETKETPLWRRPSLTFASEENIQDSKDNNGGRRTLIGSLASRPQLDKLVLYIPQRSATPTRSKSLYRHGSTGTGEGASSKTSQAQDPRASTVGTEEGFNRFASIRSSRKFRQGPEDPPTPTRLLDSRIDAGGDYNSKLSDTKSPNEASSSRLKVIFGQGKQKSEKAPLRRTVSFDSNHKPSLKALNAGRSKMNSPSTIGERDEGFEESQSSLSESNGQVDSSFPSRSNQIGTRRGGFREGREALSTRSIVAAQRAAASVAKQSVPSTIKTATCASTPPEAKAMNNIGKSISRSSLLSSRNALSSQSTSREKFQNANSVKTGKPPSAVKLTRSTSTTVNPNPPTSRLQKSATQSKLNTDDLKNSSADIKKAGVVKSGIPKQASSRILNFMRPTASSSARDKVELSTSSVPLTVNNKRGDISQPKRIFKP